MRGGFWRCEYLCGFKPAPYLRLEFHSETSERGFTFANQLLGAVKGGCLGGGKAHIITTWPSAFQIKHFRSLTWSMLSKLLRGDVFWAVGGALIQRSNMWHMLMFFHRHKHYNYHRFHVTRDSILMPGKNKRSCMLPTHPRAKETWNLGRSAILFI